jgi:hypothetical protein
MSLFFRWTKPQPTAGIRLRLAVGFQMLPNVTLTFVDHGEYIPAKTSPVNIFCVVQISLAGRIFLCKMAPSATETTNAPQAKDRNHRN